MIQVFALNMTYDVPVKIGSFHLILCSLVLLVPESRRMINFFLLDRATGASTQPPLFRTVRANRIALILQIAFGLYLTAINSWFGVGRWYAYGGGGQPKPSIYGIWNVERMAIDDQNRPPILADHDRMRRVIFDIGTSAQAWPAHSSENVQQFNGRL